VVQQTAGRAAAPESAPAAPLSSGGRAEDRELTRDQDRGRRLLRRLVRRRPAPAARGDRRSRAITAQDP